MSDVHWEDPPPVVHRNVPSSKTLALAAFADELRDHEGKWAVYPLPLSSKDSVRTTAQRVKAGRWTPGVGFEAVTRNTDDGYRLYVRYVGTSAGTALAAPSASTGAEGERGTAS